MTLDSARQQLERLADCAANGEATRADADAFRAAYKLATRVIFAQAASRRHHQNSQKFAWNQKIKDADLAQNSRVGPKILILFSADLLIITPTITSTYLRT